MEPTCNSDKTFRALCTGSQGSILYNCLLLYVVNLFEGEKRKDMGKSGEASPFQRVEYDILSMANCQRDQTPMDHNFSSPPVVSSALHVNSFIVTVSTLMCLGELTLKFTSTSIICLRGFMSSALDGRTSFIRHFEKVPLSLECCLTVRPFLPVFEILASCDYRRLVKSVLPIFIHIWVQLTPKGPNA
ncbi:hypothetical protein NC651_025998 [Populus alba x Populus x berolinensis]|nr:hypothetical protein NC651_025998 [Populus alba x Populus x berolinensis]